MQGKRSGKGLANSGNLSDDTLLCALGPRDGVINKGPEARGGDKGTDPRGRMSSRQNRTQEYFGKFDTVR
eukprot:8594833-Pyramimonas_sp.AAC.1